MIVKFCFENEIHRCSDPPAKFEELSAFLANMFRTALPSEFNLFYVNSDKENIPLVSDEDYQKLKEKESQKPIKIVIVEKEKPKEPVSEVQPDASGYEVIRQSSEAEQVVIPQVREEEKPLLKHSDTAEDKKVVYPSLEQPKEEYPEIIDKISEDFTNIHVMPRLNELQSDPLAQDHVKKIVRDVLSEQVPYIISQVKESLIREGLVTVPRNNGYAYGQYQYQPVRNHNWSSLGSQPYNNYQNQAPYQNVQYRPVPQNGEQNQDDDFFGKVVKAISDLPGKAVEMVDNLAQKMEGDPYVMVAEGKYTRNTVDKVIQLQEIFPEEERKKLLDFVQGLPKTMPIDQIVDLYVSRGDEAH